MPNGQLLISKKLNDYFEQSPGYLGATLGDAYQARTLAVTQTQMTQAMTRLDWLLKEADSKPVRVKLAPLKRAIN